MVLLGQAVERASDDDGPFPIRDGAVEHFDAVTVTPHCAGEQVSR